ncbi:MAG: fimbrial protein [Leclercia sp.]
MKNQFRVIAALVGVMASGAAFSSTSGVSVNPGSGAGTQGTGGVVEFSGEIVDASCNVTPVSKDVKVDLGTWAKSYFAAIGDETTKTPFTISVDNCPTSVKTVAVLFDGQKDATDSTLLAVTSGGAAGVGIKLYNGGATATQVDLGTVSASVPVASGKATLPFFADYTSTVQNVTVGHANGVANFLMVYN